VRVLVVVLVARAAVAEAHLAGQSGLDEELERAVDGRVADSRVFLLDEVIEVFAGEVLLGAQEDFEDEVALRRALEARVLDVPVKDVFLFGEFFSHGHFPQTPPVCHTELPATPTVRPF
jgi:hypothetical protein